MTICLTQLMMLKNMSIKKLTLEIVRCAGVELDDIRDMIGLMSSSPRVDSSG